MESKQGYTAADLTYLPLTINLGQSSTFKVEYMRDGDLQICFDLIQEAAKRGDNVGVDEFSDMDDYKDLLLSCSHSFVIRDDIGIKGQMVIKPDFARSCDPMKAELYVFLSGVIQKIPSALSQLIGLGEKLICDLDLGYIACVVQVALPCRRWQIALANLGYVTVAILPKSVNHLGKGLVGNCMMYKRLKQETRPRRSLDEMEKVASLWFDPRDSLSEVMTHFPGFPQEYYFRDGTVAILRNAMDPDADVLYQLFNEAASEGEGFVNDEIVSMSQFLDNFFKAAFVCIIQEKCGSKLIGAFIIGSTPHKRTIHTESAEVMTILHPDFRGRGYGKDLIKITQSLAKDVGFKYVLNDSFTCNAVVGSMISSNSDIIFVGSLPFAGYVSPHGWVEMRFDFMKMDINNTPTVKDLCLGSIKQSSDISQIKVQCKL